MINDVTLQNIQSAMNARLQPLFDLVRDFEASVPAIEPGPFRQLFETLVGELRDSLDRVASRVHARGPFPDKETFKEVCKSEVRRPLTILDRLQGLCGSVA